MDFLTEERDGQGFVNWILSGDDAMSKWLVNLCEAERHGAIKFNNLIKVLIAKGLDPWLELELRRMQHQEATHYGLVKNVLEVRGLSEFRTEPWPESVNAMYMAERRAVMRFTTLIRNADKLDGDVYNIAHTILPDEAYHVVICQELIGRWGDLVI